MGEKQVTIQLQPKILKALRLFVAQKDVRYYLKGICITSNDKGLRLTASNGASITTYFEPGDHGETFELIMDPDAVDAAIKLAGKSPSVALDPEALTLGSLKFTPVDGKYPDAERVWPREMDGKPCALDPALYALIEKANKSLGLKSTTLKIFSSSTCIVWDNGTIRGVMMALRESVGEPQNYPKW
jgi:DNA polymerase III sliding clamp (beta) subunit (PCNA family)